ncbi:MAG: DapH/DapD/GlmU-related protein [Puniceicoccaceae bacterium]
MSRLSRYLHAKYRGFAPLSCLASPHPDVVGGYRKWRWLWRMRRGGRLIEPSVRIRCGKAFPERLLLAERAQMDKEVIIWLGESQGSIGRISLGYKSYVGPYSFLGSCHNLVVGDYSMIGAHCYLITVNHRIDKEDVPYAEQGYRGGDIVIGRNVWLGSHVVVLPGVEIGDNAVIGAGAVVNRSIPAGERWGGVPAKPLSKG